MKIRISFAIATLFAPVLLAGVAHAQEDEADPPPDESTEIPIDDYDRGTPARSASGFLQAVDRADYTVAIEYLDLRNLRGEARDENPEELARGFAVVINRAKWVDVAELIDHPDGRLNDGLPDYRDLIGIVSVDGSNQQLWMQKVPRADGVNIWKISNATISLVPDLYEIYGYPDYVEQLRTSLPDVTFLGFELFKWVLLLATAGATYLAMLTIALVVRRALVRRGATGARQLFRLLIGPAGIWLAVLMMNYVASVLGKGVTAEAILRYNPIPTLLTIWLLFSIINLFRDVYSAHLTKSGRQGAKAIAKPAGSAFKLIVAIAALLIYLDKLGVNITAVIAGLGVGGIAVALALQKPMEDILGAITLYAQQPIRVGDFCRIGTETGTIEEIGLRATRMRTLADTVIAIPNSQLANSPIDNFSARNRILYRPYLRVRYETSPQQLDTILQRIRELFANHERLEQGNHRVRFVEIAGDSLVLEAYAYVKTTIWTDYLETAEELNMAILNIVNEAGTALFEKPLFIEGLGERRSAV